MDASCLLFETEMDNKVYGGNRDSYPEGEKVSTKILKFVSLSYCENGGTLIKVIKSQVRKIHNL